MDIARRESIPRLSFSRRSVLVEAGVKKPVTATSVITDVGTTFSFFCFVVFCFALLLRSCVFLNKFERTFDKCEGKNIFFKY